MGASEGRHARIRHRVEYALFRLAAACAGLLPGRWVRGLGAVAGWLAGSVLGIRRRVTAENLARAFPGRSSAWRARMARESYRHLGRTAATTFRLARLTRAEILALSPGGRAGAAGGAGGARRGRHTGDRPHRQLGSRGRGAGVP